MPKHHTDQNVVGLHDANHGFTIVSFPPTHKANNDTAHTGPKQRRMGDGGIGGGRCCRRRPLFSFVNNVFDGGGTPSSSDRGCVTTVSLLVFIRRCRVAVHLPIPMMSTTATTTTRRTMTTTMTRRTMTTRKTMTMTIMTMPTTTMTAPAADQSPPWRRRRCRLPAYRKEAGWQGATMMGGGGRGGGG